MHQDYKHASVDYLFTHTKEKFNLKKKL